MNTLKICFNEKITKMILQLLSARSHNLFPRRACSQLIKAFPSVLFSQIELSRQQGTSVINIHGYCTVLTFCCLATCHMYVFEKVHRHFLEKK